MKLVGAGQKITILNKDKTVTFFESVIENVDYDRLSIRYPDSSLKDIPNFQEGEDISCSTITPYGVRLFSAVVIDNDENGCLVIDFSDETFQLREFLRMNANLIAVIETENAVTRVQTLDLGGGGIRFLSDSEDIIPDVPAEMKIILNKDEPFVRICGKIIKRDYYEDNEYLFLFTDISEYARTKIIKKCIELQSTQVRKILEENGSND